MRDDDTTNNNDQTSYRQGQFFLQLSECTSVKQYKDRILATVSQLGFSDFSFTALNAPSSKYITTLPEKVRQQYLKNNLAECDLFLEHAQVKGTPLMQSAIENYIENCPFASERLERNRQQFKLLASLGYHDCYCLPHTSDINSRRAVFVLFARGSQREEFARKVEKYQYVIPFLAEAIAYFGFSKFPEHFLDKHHHGGMSITPKPLQLLVTLAKEGLTLKESANKLCISVDTANKHVAAAKQSLGATTLANAVYLAMTHGIINAEE